MGPIEKFEASCTVVVVSQNPNQLQQQQQQQQQNTNNYDISLSEFSDIYNEYLSDHSETETTSTTTTASSDTDSSTSASITKLNNQKIKEDFENLKNSQNRNNRLNSNHNHLFGVQLEVNFLLLEAERRKLKILQQELNLTLEECDKYSKSKQSRDQCHELIVAIA